METRNIEETEDSEEAAATTRKSIWQLWGFDTKPSSSRKQSPWVFTIWNRLASQWKSCGIECSRTSRFSRRERFHRPDLAGNFVRSNPLRSAVQTLSSPYANTPERREFQKTLTQHSRQTFGNGGNWARSHFTLFPQRQEMAPPHALWHKMLKQQWWQIPRKTCYYIDYEKDNKNDDALMAGTLWSCIFPT